MQRPVALENQSEQRRAAAEDQGAPRTGQVAETGVQTEHHDRTGSAQPEGAHDRREHVDIIHLREEQGYDQEEE